MSGCKGVIGLLFGHKFAPRYDTEPTHVSVKEVPAYVLQLLLESAVKSKYRNDVCTRCGAISNKEFP